MPFLAAGYPDLATTKLTLERLQAAGASMIEIGFPFSDPIADGPVVQEAFTAALNRNLRLTDIFEAVRAVRPALSIPLVAMVSYSIVYRYGTAEFVAEAKAAGFDGLILPDLPPPEAGLVCEQVQEGGLDTILLCAPTTKPERRRQIAELSSGFIYYLSVSGVTGERDKLPADVAENLRQLKSETDKPVCVGFGISKAEHLQQLKGLADGAIVGSAVIRRMKEHAGDPHDAANAAAGFCRELLVTK